MKQVKVQQLNEKVFSRYGSFQDMLNPSGDKLAPGVVEFYRDMASITLGSCNQPSFSVTHVQKRPLIIEKLEYHDRTGEAFMPLDGDVIIHLAPASRPSDVPVESIEAFLVPKGTLITIKPGVWHQAPYAVGEETVNVMVVLPERTYANDCNVILFSEEQKLQLIN